MLLVIKMRSDFPSTVLKKKNHDQLADRRIEKQKTDQKNLLPMDFSNFLIMASAEDNKED